MTITKILLLWTLLCTKSSQLPVSTLLTTEPNVNTPTENTTAEPTPLTKNLAKEDSVPSPKIYEMRITTNVSNRFARTFVQSKIRNEATTAQEAMFSVILPEDAYISSFILDIDGEKYESYVKEKEEAQHIYNKAVGRNQVSALVEARDSNRFTVFVNLQAHSTATLTLNYEELLQRKNDLYEIVINIHPGQVVKELIVQINVNESRPLRFLRSAPFRSGTNIGNHDTTLKCDVTLFNSKTGTVKFNPNIEQQKQLANAVGKKEEDGVAGQFVVEYDVERDPFGGEVLVKDGYFVHFFAPLDLPTVPKHVIFVLDTSASMDGIRVQQLKKAMNSILAELGTADVFHIVEFSSTVKVWNIDTLEVVYEESDDTWAPYEEQIIRSKQKLPRASPVNDETIEKSNKVIEKLSAIGGTNIQNALLVALKLNEEDAQQIIFFLTDGEPTVGETNSENIITTITEANNAAKKSSIFCLSFGDEADRSFLHKLSLKNQGISRHIYEGADAGLQLVEFYHQIASLRITNIHFKYLDNVQNLTKNRFPVWFNGAELVVSGYSTEEFPALEVEANNLNKTMSFTPQHQNPIESIERIWAYMTVKQLLEQRDIAPNKDLYTKKAIQLALKYGFVTAVTSLVVVKPDEIKAVNVEDAAKQTFENFDNSNRINVQQAVPLSIYDEHSIFTKRVAEFLPFNSENEVEITTIFPDVTTLSPWTPTKSLSSLLPWLNDVLAGDNTIFFSNKTYYLYANSTLSNTKKQCVNSPTTEQFGFCTPLSECPHILPSLHNISVFEQHFCALEKDMLPTSKFNFLLNFYSQ